MSKAFVIGRKVTLPNGHEYMAEPFIIFETEAGADGAVEMIQKVSGERVLKSEAAFYRRGETSADKVHSVRDVA